MVYHRLYYSPCVAILFQHLTNTYGHLFPILQAQLRPTRLLNLHPGVRAFGRRSARVPDSSDSVCPTKTFGFTGDVFCCEYVIYYIETEMSIMTTRAQYGRRILLFLVYLHQISLRSIFTK